MTIPLTGAGSLFVKLGHVGGRVLDVIALKGGTATARVLSGIPAGVALLETDYNAGTPEANILDGIYTSVSGFQGAQAGFLTQLQQLAAKTVIDMVALDLGLTNYPPATAPVLPALKTLISQMAGVATVKASVLSVGSQTAVGSPNGNPVIVVSVIGGNGLTEEYAFPDTLTFTCTTDSQRGAVLGNEIVTVTGKPLVSDVFSHLWPGGSGVNVPLNAVDGSKSNAGGNLLQNSDFATYTTTDQADNWTYVVGAATTDFFNAGTAYATGGGVLKILGTGAALLDT